jgi:hypothetical protein
LYRVRQFWRTITANNDPPELERALSLLNPEQAGLFLRLQTGEKNHAMAMLRTLTRQGEKHPDLLVAALLHDVGKVNYPMNPLERALVVLLRAFLPRQAQQWGEVPRAGWESTPSWRKPFVLAAQHSQWGAQLAEKSGVRPLTEALIRLHERRHAAELGNIENDLLNKLWMADNES